MNVGGLDNLIQYTLMPDENASFFPTDLIFLLSITYME